MKMSTEFWEGHVAVAKRETISASEYARRHGISVAALYYWQRKLKSASASPFVELRVLDKQVMPPCLCTLVLPSDLRLKLTVLPEPSWLAVQQGK